ncbi:MAG TPA: DNA cytosine methyltransferase [Noviherbaspirillum sp.]|nr:DNA cytosine methyltransferase [Noviherbaspirillum sp.]
MMEGYYIKKIGQHRGAPRVWLEGTQVERAGLAVGQKFDIVVQGQMVVLQANPDGSRVVSGKVMGERNNPIIDVNSKALLALFDGMAAIRVVAKKGEIYLLPLASELKKRERFQRLREKLEKGDPLAIGSVSHGGGVLSHAVHTGLAEAGIESKLAFANEIRGELLEHAAIHNDAWSDSTQVLASPMQEIAFDDRGVASIPKVEILEMGLPCSGASKAGKSKRGLDHPEAHPEVGHLVVSALIIASKTNPAIVLLENVPEYSQSASAHILRNQLRDMGYVTHERILNGKEWGSLENRNRWCMVAVTQGIEFDFDQLRPPSEYQKLVADVIDHSISPDDPRWRTFEYLKEKEVRDAEKGSSFSMQIVALTDDSVPTLRKGYAKGGSTDALLRHPEDPELLRQFTPQEHARIKGVPETLIAGLSNTIAHGLLGQGIVYRPFKDVGTHVGNTLNQFAGKEPVPNDVNTNRAPKPLPLFSGVAAAQLELTASPEVDGIQPQQQQFDMLDVVNQGAYSGMVLSVADGIATQKVNRAGETVRHEIVRLSQEVKPGEVVDIQYKNGVGQVAAKSRGLER